MTRRFWLSGPLTIGFLLLACTGNDPVGGDGGGGNGGGGGTGGAPLEPMEFNASVNSDAPAGYTIGSDQPYEWQAYIRYNSAWVPVGISQTSDGPSAHLLIDCNNSEMHAACTSHLAGMVQVTVTKVAPGPARLCAYKSGFKWQDGLLLNTPLGILGLAPVASSSMDPGNAGVCYP